MTMTMRRRRRRRRGRIRVVLFVRTTPRDDDAPGRRPRGGPTSRRSARARTGAAARRTRPPCPRYRSSPRSSGARTGSRCAGSVTTPSRARCGGF
jgi:hypothetical protein